MSIAEIEMVINTWEQQHSELSQTYRWVQIFENKGEIMGCSNPHPHGQIWASDFLPNLPAMEEESQRDYWRRTGGVLLLDYMEEELNRQERLVAVNPTWVALVPYWAVWPFEIMLLPRAHTRSFSELDHAQKVGLAEMMKTVLVKYDNIFTTSFPYSMGWHGAPSSSSKRDHWHLHAHYYPPLLRSATIKKFMVGYEMLACAQRDITPESAASIIREQSTTHYSQHA